MLVHDDANKKNLDDFYQIDELDNFTITFNMVNDILQKLKEHKSLDDDGLNTLIKKNVTK